MKHISITPNEDGTSAKLEASEGGVEMSADMLDTLARTASDVATWMRERKGKRPMAVLFPGANVLKTGP